MRLSIYLAHASQTNNASSQINTAIEIKVFFSVLQIAFRIPHIPHMGSFSVDPQQQPPALSNSLTFYHCVK